MKLTFKDLKQQKFTLEAEPSDTIAQVKEKIFKHKDEGKEWDPCLQKLIYSGKILADEKTVEFYKVEEKGFIVCMLAKPKPAAASTSSTPAKTPSTPLQSTKPVTPAAPAPAGLPSSSTAPVTPSPAGSATVFNDPSALALGPLREAAISNMVEMGFGLEEINDAMKAAFNNPDRAVDYLMNGIPEHLQRSNRAETTAAAQPDTAQSSASPTAPPASSVTEPAEDSENINLFEAAAAAANRSASAGAGGAGSQGLSGLDFLRNNQQFQQLRRLVQESPHMLEPILQQVGAGNPQLAALISQNPDAFLQLLAEGVENEDDSEGGLPGLHTISVTPEEAEAINRLCGLGFSRDMVIQAYIACDKNEELTANYLFDNPNDDDEMGGA